MIIRTYQKGAFTLIELLVVIAIIAVLMGILMPALSAVKKQAKAIHCVNNVKNLSMAWFMYKDENDDKLVNGIGGGATTKPRPWVLDPIGSFSNSAVENEKEGIRQGALFPYIGKSIDSFQCPADMRVINGRNPVFRSYSIAGGMYGLDPENPLALANWEIVPHTKYSTIKKPAQKMVFVAEAGDREWNKGSWVLHPKSKGWVDPFAIWHTKSRSTLGYADGHAEMHRWKSKGLVDWCASVWNNPDKDFQFYRKPADQEEMDDLEWMIDHYAYRRLL